MKIKNFSLFSLHFSLLLMLASITSCVKDPDGENLYTFTDQTISDYLNEHAEYSDFNYIIKRADLDQLMSSYGQYTCFAPTNEAVQKYIDSLYNDDTNRIFKHNGMTENSLEGLSDSLCEDIAKYHLSNSYLSTIDMSGGISVTTMLTRTITSGTDTLGRTVLNTTSAIIEKDVQLSNGYFHGVNQVIPRSNRTMGDELKMHLDMFSIFNEALQITGLADSLMEKEKTTSLGTAPTESGWWIPTTCKIGYTLFAETDEVFKKAGINSFEDLVAYVNNVYGNCADKSEGWYDYMKDRGLEVSTKSDYTNPYNALNLFVRYHILKYSIPYDYLIIDQHYTHDLGSECYEYYETMLPKTLLKIWQKSRHLCINRYETYNTLTNEVEGFGDIHTVEKSGILLGKEASLQPINGYIHPIYGVLVYDSDVPKKVLNERMRFDILSCLPEMMSNGIRWMSKAEAVVMNGGKSTSRARLSSKYCDNIRMYNTTTKLDYNFHDTGDFLLYQGDALRGNGVYDLAVKLPPVPAGEYELRICYPSVTDHGGMMQFYLGTSPEIADMQAVDIPIDLRLNFAEAPSIRWTDPKEEDDLGIATDQALRARGFMRGPISYQAKGTINARWGQTGNTYNLAMRRIIVKQRFKQEDYWLRVKSVLPDNTTGIFQIDYIEFAPPYIYDNPEYVEDMY